MALILSIFNFYAIWRLNKYIGNIIEDKQDYLEEKIDVISQSLQIALGNKLINPNNRIKRPTV